MTTAQTQAGPTTMELKPYIFFYGRCEEALKFYKSVRGGTYERQRIEGSPMEGQVSPDFVNKVMHASFTAPGVAFFASDGPKAKRIDPEEGNISLALALPDRATGDRVFAALSEGGSVTSPLQDAFWGGRFGSIQDRFGNEWLITSP